MNSVRRCRKGALLLFLTMALSAVSSAQELEQVPRRLFEAQGTMQYLDLPARVVQIGGRRYRLAQNMKVYGVDPKVRLSRALQRAVGGKVGYVVDPDGSTQSLTAIWVLPREGR